MTFSPSRAPAGGRPARRRARVRLSDIAHSAGAARLRCAPSDAHRTRACIGVDRQRSATRLEDGASGAPRCATDEVCRAPPWRRRCMIAGRGRETRFFVRTTPRRWRPTQEFAQRPARGRPARQLAPHRMALRGVRRVREPPVAAGNGQAFVRAHARVAEFSAAIDPEGSRRAPSRDRSGAPAPGG